MAALRRLTPLVLASVLGVMGAELSGAGVRRGGSALRAQTQALMLRLQRRADALDVVIEGVGSQPVLQQRQNGSNWEGRLRTQGSRALDPGGQRLSLPELGIETVSLSGSGDQFELLVRRLPGQAVQDPVVSADGRNLILTFNGLGTPQLQTGRLDLNTPGRVPQSRFAPPLRPRAVAPPLGDMAVGTMVLRNRSYVNLNGPVVAVNSVSANPRSVLRGIAKEGGYSIVFLEEDQSSDRVGSSASEKTINMMFQDADISTAFNTVLLASGYQAKLTGRTIWVGKNVQSRTLGPQMSKVVRLNQVTAESAAKYLGNLGATYNLTNTKTTTTGEPAAANTAQLSTQTSQTQTTTLNSESFGASAGPLLGLVVTTDSRLQTVTMVGDSELVAVAEGYLKQIDLRQRQVALNVRILDISLANDAQLNNSFAFRSGNAFIVSDQGQLLANFGAYKPPGSAQGGLPGAYTAQEGTTPVSGTGRVVEEGQFRDQPQAPYPLPGSQTTDRGPYRPSFGTYQNPLQPGVTEIDEEGKITYEAPTRFQYPTNQFFDFLVAQIQSSSTKVLASPTLIIQEGNESALGSDSTKISSDGKVGRERANEALVSVGTRLVTSYEVRQDINGNNFCQPVFSNAGLTFGARVDKIDDNGFITFALSPEISAAVGRPEQVANCGTINVINSRALDTGKIRVRDGQTLILTGVISDEDVQTVTKWPILGDMPFIGQFFRSSGGNRRKNELVILVTPRIIDDEQGGTYGYGYQPSLPAARQVLSGS